MRLLIGDDEHVFKYKNNYYAKEGVCILYNRYIRVFEKVRIAVRVKEIDNLPSNLRQINSDQIEIWPYPFYQGPIQYVVSYLKGIKALKRVTLDCDVALVRLPSPTSHLVMKKIMRAKLPLALEIVIDPYDGYKSASNPFYGWIYKGWYNTLLKACKYAIGISCVTSKYLQQRYYPSRPDAFVSNYSSIALPKELYFSERRYPSSKKTLQIINVANEVIFGGRKGQKEIIESIAIIKSRGYDVKACFVGKDYNNGIEQLLELAKSKNVENNITFTGFLASKSAVIEKLRESDIYVLPTKAEGLPRSIIEAMSQGLPCITTNVSGNPELIQSDLLIDDFYDVNLLAEKIISLISSPSFYEEVSKRNFENSKKYEASILQGRRDEFYTKLKNVAKHDI